MLIQRYNFSSMLSLRNVLRKNMITSSVIFCLCDSNKDLLRCSSAFKFLLKALHANSEYLGDSGIDH